MKRVAFIADEHSGANSGLTPPEWWGTDCLRKVHRDTWTMYINDLVNKIKPVDVLISNGDLIEGPETPSVCITSDREIQSEMAIQAIEAWESPKIIIVEGTPFHTGKRETWESMIANRVGAEKFGAHVFVSCNGLMFDCKHFTGGTTIPRHIPPSLTRQEAWNKLKAEVGDEPKADVFVRSHIHTCLGGSKFFGGEREVHFIATPGLQAYSNYGALKVERQIHWGCIWYDVEDDGSFKMHRKIMTVKAQQAKAVIV